MIDTDKYEGHTRGPWEWSYSDDVAAQLLIIPNGNDGIGNGVCIGLGDADAQLIADAPLFLEEVKRLREGIEHALHIRLKHGQEEGWKELKELIE